MLRPKVFMFHEFTHDNRVFFSTKRAAKLFAKWLKQAMPPDWKYEIVPVAC